MTAIPSVTLLRLSVEFHVGAGGSYTIETVPGGIGMTFQKTWGSELHVGSSRNTDCTEGCCMRIGLGEYLVVVGVLGAAIGALCEVRQRSGNSW